MIKISPKKLRIIKIVFVVIVVVSLIIDASVYFAPSLVHNLLRIYYRSPVTFQNMEINFPKGITFNKDEKSIIFSEWNNSFPNLYIYKFTNLKNKGTKSLLEYYGDANFKIISSESSDFQGHESTVVYYVDPNWRFKRTIVIEDLNLIIEYSGPKDEFTLFEGIIRDIKLGEKPK